MEKKDVYTTVNSVSEPTSLIYQHPKDVSFIHPPDAPNYILSGQTTYVPYATVSLSETNHYPNQQPNNQDFYPSSEAQTYALSDQVAWVAPFWQSYSIIYVLLLLGIMAAISHHVFYSSLVGKEAVGQLKMLRYGTALSYIAKASLVGAVLIAYRQQVWATCSRKPLSISAIDSLFVAGSDPLGLANLEIFSKAKVAVFLVAIVWLTPLAVILTPATLTVELATMTNRSVCTSVRTLNFDTEATNNWREGKKLSGMVTLSLSWWNTTGTDVNDPNTFDYYTSPSFQLGQAATLSTYLQKVIANDNIASDVCGAGWNCSYTINFIAPGYQCTKLAEGRDNNSTELAQMGAPFNTNSLLPDGNFSYQTHATLGEYSTQQIDAGGSGIPIQQAPFPRDLGALRTEPVLWIGHSVLAPGNSTLPINSSDPRWSEAFIPQIFSCEHRLTNYTVLFNYTSSQQTTTVLRREFLEKIINTTYVPKVDANDGTKDNVTATPPENYIFPQDVQRYRQTGAYHSLGMQLRNFINGTIDLANTITPIGNTEATLTTLIDTHSYLPFPDLADRVQGLYEDIILSLLSNPQFLAVAWGGDPQKESTIGINTGPEATYPCTKSRTFNQFAYHVWQLWLVYGMAIALAIIGVFLGTVAIVQNAGDVRDMRFSTIVKASRTRSLDDLPWRRGLGGAVTKDVLRGQLQYGILREDGIQNTRDGVTSYAGFGKESNVIVPGGNMSNSQRILSWKPWQHDSH